MIPIPERVDHSESEERFATLFYRSPVALILTSMADGRIVDVNDAYCRLVGYPREELIGRTTLEIGLWANPSDRQKVVDLLQRDGRVRQLEIALRRPTGENRHLEVSFEATRLNGQDCFISTALDVTERMLATNALLEREKLFRHVTRMTSDLFYTCALENDGYFKLKWLGGNAMRLFGISNEALQELGCWRGFVVEADLPLFDRHITDLRPKEIGKAELRIQHKDGTIFHVRSFSEVETDAEGGHHRLFGALEDVTDRVLLEQKLEHQAHTDALTGLVNRGHFLELAAKELPRARRYRNPVSIAMLDLDYFKAINDSHGHESGDHVLKRFAAICRASLRESDLLARIGGEEFVILFPETTCEKAREVAERIRENVAAATVPSAQGEAIRFTTSIGIAELSESDKNIDALISRADRVLYEAKRSGRNRTCVAPLPA
jgi:diguanylate cyclase (GGDEF)-like protein/PAS domain S-box-containing protein